MINIDDFIYKSFGIKSSEYLITKDFRLIIFCENEYSDICITTPFDYYHSHQVTFLSDDIKIDKFQHQISQPIKIEFHLSIKILKIISRNHKKINNTHIRFNNVNDLLEITLLDYLTSISSKIKIFDVRVDEDFSFIIKTSSFLKLPQSDYDVEYCENGIINFISLCGSDNEYHIMNQPIYTNS